MRICLVNPPNVMHGSYPYVYQPLGLMYIAGVLEKGHQVAVIDAAAEGWRNLRINQSKYYLGLEYHEIASRVKEFSPNIVGITAMWSQGAEGIFEVAHQVKSVLKDTAVVVGGAHASVRPFDLLSTGDVDFVVVGEGENTITELLQVLEQGKRDALKSVEGIAYLKDGELIMTSPRPLITDLDALPFPARHLFPMDAYFQGGKKIAAPIPVRRPWAAMITSRGCPYRCIFCSIHLTMGREFRARSPENVVAEIEQLAKEYGVRQLSFDDDNLTLNKRRIHRILDLMIEKQLDVAWYAPNAVRADTIDEELLRKMKRAGCQKLWLSPESGVQRVVDQIINKRLDLKRVEEAVALCKKLGVWVGCNFVMGLIGETKEDIRKTIEYARRLKRLGAKQINVYIATPYYGTELHEQAKEKGYLLEGFDERKLIAREPLIETPEFTAQELRELYKQAITINPLLSHGGFSRATIARALKHPRRSLGILLERAEYVLKGKPA